MARGGIYYDVAQVCLSGHLITANARSHLQDHRSRCRRCGEATITQCPHCQEFIIGDYVGPDLISGLAYSVPRFCEGCGRPYPWLGRQAEAAQEMANEIDGLDPTERAALRQDLATIMKDIREAEPAALRVKKYPLKAAKGGGRVVEVKIGEAAVKFGADKAIPILQNWMVNL